MDKSETDVEKNESEDTVLEERAHVEYQEPEEYVEPQPRKIEITIAEAEVMKITPEPGDVLFFKFKGDGFHDGDVNELGRQLRTLFPANKVVVMALPSEHDVELTTVKNQDKVEPVAESDCSKPTDYCNSCGCGKKERIEAERNKT